LIEILSVSSFLRVCQLTYGNDMGSKESFDIPFSFIVGRWAIEVLMPDGQL
jgi:hypothetical protein